MAKSKNHTNHNQNQKDHKNGIKRIQRPLHKGALVGKCMKGVYPKYHDATKKSKAALRAQRVEAAKQKRGE